MAIALKLTACLCLFMLFLYFELIVNVVSQNAPKSKGAKKAAMPGVRKTPVKVPLQRQKGKKAIKETIKTYNRTDAEGRPVQRVVVKKPTPKPVKHEGPRAKMHTHQEVETMIYVQGKKFTMGVNDPTSQTGEYPPKKVEVRAFKIDKYPVTVGDFMRYKREKFKYTTDAERRGYSYVFFSLVANISFIKEDVSLEGEPWWFAINGAKWDQPEGPGSNVTERLDYPTTHVSFYDASAFCMWAGKRLPLEIEWEAAARGNKKGLRYPWGESYKRNRMNTWQGVFPEENKYETGDGFEGVSPVNAYVPQNDLGMYDMVGNVWEWTASPFTLRPVDMTPQERALAKVATVKGGSFLDTKDGRANLEARSGARKGVLKDFTSQNIGFRCAQTVIHAEKKTTTPPPPKKKSKHKFPQPEGNTGKQIPRVHLYSETWAYKVKQRLKTLFGQDDNDPKAVELKKYKQEL